MIALSLVASLFFGVTNIELYANQGLANILHEEKEIQVITSGVVYEKNRRFTQDGWIDIHVMTIDVNNPNVELDVLDSVKEFGLREPLKDLATAKGAVAGINGDFFNMSKNPSDTEGLTVKDGKMQSLTNYLNYTPNHRASFVVNNDGLPAIDFYRMFTSFQNGDGIALDLHGINRVANFSKPVYVDRTVGTTTANIDKQNPGLYKIVVQDNIIIHISGKGETVTIPENGFVILMNEATAQAKLSSYAVGQWGSNQHSFGATIPMKMAITGGGKILAQGQPVTGGYVVGANQRHPRTAIGISQDVSKVMFFVVDGRSHSVGVTHAELAAIVKQYGAYEAMHFDGGGSTTMVGRPMGTSQLQVLNTLSDGAQRRIVNGIGVISRAPQGSLTKMQLKADAERVFQGTGVRFELIGVDQYDNPVSISLDQAILQVSGVEGHWAGGIFYPQSSGKAEITAQIGAVLASTSINVMGSPIALEMTPKVIKTQTGQKTSLSIVGLDQEGYQGKVNGQGIQWTVDANLGRVENGVFIAGDQAGHGSIVGQIGNTKVNGYVIVGDQKTVIDSFEELGKVQFTSYPSYVKSIGNYTSNLTRTGRYAVELHYGLEQKEAETQAAYVDFVEPKAFPGQPMGIGLWVYGDGQGHWLRGRIKDQKGSTHTIDFADQIDWTGWKYVQATIPKTVQYPISLERIYITAVKNEIPHESTLYIDDLTAVYPIAVSDLVIPDGTVFQDPLQSRLPDEMVGPGFDITVFGSTAGKNSLLDDVIQRQVVEKMDNKAAFSIFAGYTDMAGFRMNHPYYAWKDQYEKNTYQNVKIIQLGTSKNGMRATKAEQWRWLKQDLAEATEDHIILVLNKDPLDSINGFTDALEGELFHKILKEYREKTGKTIFVINGSGYHFGSHLHEGIRYIDLNGLWYQPNGNKKVNLQEQFSILRFRVQGKSIVYDFQPIYEYR